MLTGRHAGPVPVSNLTWPQQCDLVGCAFRLLCPIRTHRCHKDWGVCAIVVICDHTTLFQSGLADTQGASTADVGRTAVSRRPIAGLTGSALPRTMRLAALAMPLLLTGCDWAVLDPKGFVGHSDVTILI